MNQAGRSYWLAHPHIHRGEALSSWLHRFAQANGMADHTFCRHVLGGRAGWNRDLDRFTDDALLQLAASITGESLDRLRLGVLSAAEGVVFPKYRVRGELQWVLPQGVRARKRTAFGQQYCPECLRKEGPWLQLAWRFAWATVCTRHCVWLRDCCGNCGNPITLHRVSSHPLRGLLCSHCGRALAAAGQPAPRAVVSFQRLLERAYTKGVVQWHGNVESSIDVFEGLRAMVRCAPTTRRDVGLVDLMPSYIYRARPANPGMGIEHCRFSERRYFLDVIRRALIGWPDAFVQAASSAGIYRRHFDGRTRVTHPAWLESALVNLERPVANLQLRWENRRAT